MSGTIDSARLAAAESTIKVHVVDSRAMAMAFGFGVLAAADAAAAGADGEEVARQRRRRCADTDTFFYVDTLEYLKRGGRIGPPRRPGVGVRGQAAVAPRGRSDRPAGEGADGVSGDRPIGGARRRVRRGAPGRYRRPASRRRGRAAEIAGDRLKARSPGCGDSSSRRSVRSSAPTSDRAWWPSPSARSERGPRNPCGLGRADRSWPLVGYFVGTISPATWIARARGVDIAHSGSGNPGRPTPVGSWGAGPGWWWRSSTSVRA